MKQALSTLIKSALGATPVYLMRAPVNKKPPYVVYQDVISTIEEDIQLCAALQQTTVQFDVYSTKYDAAFQAIIAAVKSIHGTHDTDIRLALISSEQEFYEEETKFFRRSIDIDIHHIR